MRHTLRENEQELQVYRKHELTLAPVVLQVFALIFIPWYFGIEYDFISSAPWHADLFFIGTLAVAGYALQRFVIWYMDYYVVTSERLQHIQHQNAFKRTVTETSLDRILNVSYKTTGFFSTLFHYGDVSIQAVGMDQPFLIEAVPDPEKVKDYIWAEHLKHGGGTHITYTKPAVGVVHANDPENENEQS
jgi:hypothetical protein